MHTLAALPRRTLYTTVLLLAFLLGWQVWTAVAAEGKLPPNVRQALADHGQANVAVRLGFEPEKFHMTYFQEKARVVGVKGEWIYLENADAAALDDIARQYWVEDIQLVRSP
ncbi:MAG: hypothetical protein M1401_15705 [Chloroflexi bacterium]|nr:hypothetical protein [Chloroflexota bacterium]MCL5110273.1 hypothetical protein [Chloroflexota bacterium]